VHAHLEGPGELAVGLVVAVQDHPLRRDPGPQDQVELAPGRHVDAQARLVGEARDRPAQEGLGGEGHAVVEGGGGLLAPVAQGGLVVDEEGGGVALGQLGEVDPTDRHPVVAHLGGVGKE